MGGVVKLERVWGICPACGQQVEAVARDGQVRGYCAVARQSVDFLIETQPRIGKNHTAETRAKISATHTGQHHTVETRVKISASLKERWQDPEYRAKQVATHTGKYPTDETRAKISAALTYKKKRGKGIPKLVARPGTSFLKPRHTVVKNKGSSRASE